MKLVFAAPARGLPSLPIAVGSHASRVHFATKLFSAAPARGLPFLPIAWLWQGLSAIAAELSKNVISRAARPIRFILILHSLSKSQFRLLDHHQLHHHMARLGRVVPEVGWRPRGRLLVMFLVVGGGLLSLGSTGLAIRSSQHIGGNR